MKTILRDAMQAHACAFLLEASSCLKNFGCDCRSGFWGAFVLKGSYEGFKKWINDFRSFLKNQRKRMTRTLLYTGHVST